MRDRLTVLTLEQSDTWDKIVKSFQDYDVYYLSGYVKAFELHGDGEPLLFYYDDGNNRGINVVMKRDISMDERFQNKIMPDTLFDFATPYGYGGWLVEGCTDCTNLFDTYENWCKENHVVSEFVRFHPVLGNHSLAEAFYEVVLLGKTVVIDLQSKEQIWTNLKSTNRNKIRKAEKNGVKIYHGNYPEIFVIFREIYDATMDKDNAADYYYFDNRFYGSIMNDLPYNSEVFYAVLEKKVIAAAIMLIANGRMNYHLSGSVREYQNLAPTNLLLYEAAVWGSENGYRTLHLGGGVGAKEDNLYQFKKVFNKEEPCQFHVGKKIYLEEKYQELIGFRDDFDRESTFFPLYRR